MQTKSAFIAAATSSDSNDSCAITWHQWQAAYPTDSRIGTSRRRAVAKASSPHSYQSTGLSLCCNKYGDVDAARRFVTSTPGRLSGPDRLHLAARAGSSLRAQDEGT